MNDSNDRIDYPSRGYYEIWEKLSSVRSKPRKFIHESKEDGVYYFPVSRQPIANHHLVKKRGEKVKEYILLQSCYKFMHDVSVIETEVVNAGALLVANNRLRYKFSKEIQQDAYSVIIDEAYHAYVAFDFMHQLIEKTGIAPISMPTENQVISSLKYMQEKFSDDIKDIFTVIAVCIGEHVLVKEVISTSKGTMVIKDFNDVMADHVLDEGRHSQIFSHIMTYLWKMLDNKIKDEIGPKLVEYFKLNFSSNAQQDFERKILRSINFSESEIDSIMKDIYTNTYRDGINLNNQVIYNVCKMLKRCGVFEHLLTHNAFYNYDLVPKIDFEIIQ